MAKFDWAKRCSYDVVQKRAFHREASKVLRALAGELGFEKDSFDLRSNQGGIAVSGEITLHHNDVYVQISQSAIGSDKGVMVRTCEGRKDYTGGQNYFLTYAALDDVPGLATVIRRIQPSLAVDEPDSAPAL